MDQIVLQYFQNPFNTRERKEALDRCRHGQATPEDRDLVDRLMPEYVRAQWQFAAAQRQAGLGYNYDDAIVMLGLYRSRWGDHTIGPLDADDYQLISLESSLPTNSGAGSLDLGPEYTNVPFVLGRVPAWRQVRGGSLHKHRLFPSPMDKAFVLWRGDQAMFSYNTWPGKLGFWLPATTPMTLHSQLLGEQ